MRLVVLWIGIFFSALAIVYLKHANRQLLIELHTQQSERDALNSEWTQLLLEESTLVTHSRVEEIAAQSLQMRLPQQEEMIWLRVDKQ